VGVRVGVGEGVGELGRGEAVGLGSVGAGVRGGRGEVQEVRRRVKSKK
jgi:hypothetical protein